MPQAPSEDLHLVPVTSKRREFPDTQLEELCREQAQCGKAVADPRVIFLARSDSTGGFWLGDLAVSRLTLPVCGMTWGFQVLICMSEGRHDGASHCDSRLHDLVRALRILEDYLALLDRIAKNPEARISEFGIDLALPMSPLRQVGMRDPSEFFICKQKGRSIL